VVLRMRLAFFTALCGTSMLRCLIVILPRRQWAGTELSCNQLKLSYRCSRGQ